MGILHSLLLALLSVFFILVVVFNGASGKSSNAGDGPSGSGKRSGTDLEKGTQPKTLKTANLFAFGITKGISKALPTDPVDQSNSNFCILHRN